MTDIDMLISLINRLLEQAKAMDGAPPYQRRPIDMSLGELSLAAKGLGLLAAVRQSIK